MATVGGRTYVGPHAVCFHTRDQLTEEYRLALADARRLAGADGQIGQKIRRLLLPGVKRKQYSRAELQAIVDAADEAKPNTG
jgi:hypothetical protein